MNAAGRPRRRLFRRAKPQPQDVEGSLHSLNRPRREDWRFGLLLLGDLLAPPVPPDDGAAQPASAADPVEAAPDSDAAPREAADGAAEDHRPAPAVGLHRTDGAAADDVGGGSDGVHVAGDDFAEAATIPSQVIGQDPAVLDITIDLPVILAEVAEVVDAGAEVADDTPPDDDDDTPPSEDPPEDPGEETPTDPVTETPAETPAETVTEAPTDDGETPPDPVAQEPPDVGIYIDQDIDSASDASMVVDVAGDYSETVSRTATPTTTSYQMTYTAPEGGWGGWSQINFQIDLIQWDTFLQDAEVIVLEEGEEAEEIAVEDETEEGAVAIAEAEADEEDEPGVAVTVEQAATISQKGYIAIEAAADGTILNIKGQGILYNEVTEWTGVRVDLDSDISTTTVLQTVTYDQDFIIDVDIEEALDLDLQAIFAGLGWVEQTVDVVIEIEDGEPTVLIFADQEVVLDNALSLQLDIDDTPLLLTTGEEDEAEDVAAEAPVVLSEDTADDPEEAAEEAGDTAESEDALRDLLDSAFDSEDMIAFDSFFEAWAESAEEVAEIEEAAATAAAAASPQDSETEEVEADPDLDDDDDPYSAS